MGHKGLSYQANDRWRCREAVKGTQSHCQLQYSAVTCTEHISLHQFVIQKETLECVSLCGWASSPGLSPNGSCGKAAGVLT